MKTVLLLILAMLLSFSGNAWSLSSDLAVGQLNHRMFASTDIARRSFSAREGPMIQLPDRQVGVQRPDLAGE